MQHDEDNFSEYIGKVEDFRFDEAWIRRNAAWRRDSFVRVVDFRARVGASGGVQM